MLKNEYLNVIFNFQACHRTLADVHVWSQEDSRRMRLWWVKRSSFSNMVPSAIVDAMLIGPQEYERAERERKKNFHPCRITQWRGMAVKQPRAASSPSQRTTTRKGDNARGNAPPPLTPNSTVGESLGLARTRGRGKEVQLKTIHKRLLEHSCHTSRMVIGEFESVRVRHYFAVTHY